jgi:transposase-like protein
VKYLNKIIEQDHRFIKKRVRACLEEVTAWLPVMAMKSIAMTGRRRSPGSRVGPKMPVDRSDPIKKN